MDPFGELVTRFRWLCQYTSPRIVSASLSFLSLSNIFPFWVVFIIIFYTFPIINCIIGVTCYCMFDLSWGWTCIPICIVHCVRPNLAIFSTFLPPRGILWATLTNIFPLLIGCSLDRSAFLGCLKLANIVISPLENHNVVVWCWRNSDTTRSWEVPEC